ncbi:ABC transporter ATP-binding protein [Myxosarcina sp. GI1]|uniref:ABC transporter ATP-binding protein n=1 Tax=Myxosarcina sp. GI1 TaxID=1541065 RepID=UPI000A850599|nr:ABC transporter ATP-binding protein [Myxosarcina sp. GI1]
MKKPKIARQFRTVKTRLAYLPQIFQLIWKAAGNWLVAWVALLIFQGLLPAASVAITRSLVDCLVKVGGIGVSVRAIQPILLPGILLGGVLILTELSQGLSAWVRIAQSELTQDYISELVHQKAITVDYAFYESSDYHDRLNRATSDASGQSLLLLDNTGSLIQNSITLLAMAALLVSYGLWLPVFLFASTLPGFYIILSLNQKNYRWWERTTVDRRWLDYYQLLLTHNSAVAELRLFGLGNHFKSAYQSLRSRLRREKIQLARERSLGRLWAGMLSLLISGSVLVWIGRQVLLGIMSLGDLTLFYQVFNKGQNLMRSTLSNLGEIYQNSLFLSNLFEFLQLQSQLAELSNPQPVPILKTSICFKQVSFRYPGSDRFVLQNFNLTIPAGKVAVIVGDNGAGKSTLIKLLCRFYDPEEGSIELDGVNIREISIAELRRSISAVFQFPIPYYVNAADNIALGDLEGSPNLEEIQAAAKRAGVHHVIESLPQGYSSLMGKGFAGGCELSGGEWQRIALARAFVRKAQIIILDEPTSAMDPWTEVDWFTRFRDLSIKKTAIVITHRFTLAMRADLIYVMRQGKVVESGSHEELLRRDSVYARSWKAQMKTNAKNYSS